MSGLWSTAHCPSIAKVSKVKDFALILLISIFSLTSLHLLQKDLHLSFYYTFYSLTMLTEVFIFSGKSSCCNVTFAIYVAANKEYLNKIQKNNPFDYVA